MTIENERVLRESERYADFCTRFATKLAEGSNIVLNLKKMNANIIKRNHDRGFMKIKFLEIVNADTSNIPFVELTESEKTLSYLDMENEYHINQIEFNELISQYIAFYEHSILKDFIAHASEIKRPTIENNGNFQYPLVNHRMQYMIQYIKLNQDENFSQTKKFVEQKMAQFDVDDEPIKSLYDQVDNSWTEIANNLKQLRQTLIVMNQY